MSIFEFNVYLEKYAQDYFSRYLNDLENIGDMFCCFSCDQDFYSWINTIEYSHIHRYMEVKGPTPSIDTHEMKTNLPAYACALSEFFYKKYEYPEERFLPSERKRVTELETKLSKVCHSGRSTIASWKSGTRVPDKYKWWALGISVFELNFWHIQPYLDMVSSSIDMTCIEDVILFYALCTSKSIFEIYILLEKYNCNEIKDLFSVNI